MPYRPSLQNAAHDVLGEPLVSTGRRMRTNTQRPEGMTP
jgi:hypothetical protein